MCFFQLLFLLVRRPRSSDIYVFFRRPSSKYYLLKITVFVSPSEVPNIAECTRGTFLPSQSRTDLKVTQVMSWYMSKVSLAAVCKAPSLAEL